MNFTQFSSFQKVVADFHFCGRFPDIRKRIQQKTGEGKSTIPLHLFFEQ
jgi:hypothetical protein